MTVRLNGLLKKVNKWITELESNPDNIIDVKYQHDNFMNGIFFQKYNLGMFPFSDPKTVVVPWSGQQLKIKPYIPTYEELHTYLYKVKDLLIQEMLQVKL